MKSPFKLPARFDYDVLVAADCELVCATEAATDEEKAYITLAINNHDRLKSLLRELLGVAELNYDDLWEVATEDVIRRASMLLSELDTKP